jgi:phosphatidylserine decarboxylase
MIVRDAFRFLIPLLISAGLAFLFGLNLAGLLVLLMAVFVAFFFRNPRREIPADPDIIVSPADGKVVKIERVGKVTRLSIFLSIFNVHVNRSPIAGRIESIEYRKGKFKAAFTDAASVENERNTLMITDGRIKLVVTQIAGIAARRIVCWRKVGETVEKGQLIGLIRFGSRVDVLFPAGAEVTVKVGAKVRGGSSPIGVIKQANG